MQNSVKYIDDKNHEIEETNDGYVFVDGICVMEPGSDLDFDRYSIEIQNGDGYYDSSGHYRSYSYD